MGVILRKGEKEMSWFWKLLLTIYNLLLVALGAYIVSVASGNMHLLKGLVAVFAVPSSRILAGAVGGLIFALGVIFLIASLRREKQDSLILADGAYGQVCITVPAISQVILKSARGLSGVREVRPVITGHKQGLTIYLHLLVTPDVVVPELTALLQERVKEDVEHLIGLPVAEVSVLVDEPTIKRAKG